MGARTGGPRVVGGRPGNRHPGKGGMVPIGPFRAWLDGLCLVRSDGEVAALVGVAERLVYRWRREGHWVALDNVDRCLTHVGAAGLLNDLYPACPCHGVYVADCPSWLGLAA